MNPYRLRHPWLLRALEGLSAFFTPKIFQPLHWSVQIFHLLVTRRWIRATLMRAAPGVIDVQIRHSATSWSGFHFLLSDLDITVIYPDEFSASEVENLRAACERVRARAIFVGEFEIYSATVFDWRKAAETAYPRLIEGIRQLRKAGWVADPQTLAQLPYHRMKADRAWRKIEMQRKFLIDQLGINAILHRETFIDPETLTTAARSEDRRVDFEELYNRSSGYLGPAAVFVHDPKFFSLLSILPSFTETTDLRLAPAQRYLCLHEAAQSRGKAALFPELTADLISWAEGLEQTAKRIHDALVKADRLKIFDVYGARIELVKACTSQEAFDAITQDFQYFGNENSILAPQTIVHLVTNEQSTSDVFAQGPDVRQGHSPFWCSFNTKLGRLSLGGPRRRVEFRDGTIADVFFRGDYRSVFFFFGKFGGRRKR